MQDDLLAGRYRKLKTIGIGGMAKVYLAEDERLSRRVAVKQLHADSPEDAAERFEREAKLGASLNHPNLVSIFDIATDGESVLIVMEYVHGQTLKDAISGGPMSVEDVLDVIGDVSAALDHAHGHGVVHRDVKPANILLRRDGTAKLADMGIATAVEGTRITSSGMVLGTAAYMAPEQLDGRAAGPAADVYSLATVTYEALTGQKARTGNSPMEIAHRVINDPPPDLREGWADAPDGAAETLQRAMSPNPEDRPRSAGKLMTELRRELAGDTQPATPRAAAAGVGVPVEDEARADEGPQEPPADGGPGESPRDGASAGQPVTTGRQDRPADTAPREHPPARGPSTTAESEVRPAPGRERSSRPPDFVGPSPGDRPAPERAPGPSRPAPSRSRRKLPTWVPAAAVLLVFAVIGAVVLASSGGGGGGERAERGDSAGGSPGAADKGADEGEASGESKGGSDSGSADSGGGSEGAPMGGGSSEQEGSGNGSGSGGGSSGGGGDPAALNDRGFRLMNAGRYDEAIPPLKQAVNSYPEGSTNLTYAYALYNLGRSLRLAGRPDEAVPILERRLKIPNQTETVRRELEAARKAAR